MTRQAQCDIVNHREAAGFQEAMQDRASTASAPVHTALDVHNMPLAIEASHQRVAIAGSSRKRAGCLRNDAGKLGQELPSLAGDAARHINAETGRGEMSELWRA